MSKSARAALRRREHRCALLLIAVAVVGLGAAGCGGSASSSTTGAGPVKVRAAYVPGATFLPAMVAKDAGIFRRHGLDVTLTPTQTVSTIPGTLGRQFDLGPAVPPVILKAVHNGIGVVAAAASSVEQAGNASELIVAGGSNIHSVADLKGRRLGTADTGAALHASTLNWLRASGIDPKSSPAVEMPFPTMQDQLKAGRVDAVEAIQPFSEIMIKAGARSLGAPMLSVARPRVLSTLWIAQRRWATTHADVLTRWRDSLVEAQRLIARDGPRAREILRKYTQLPAAVTESVKLPAYRAEMDTRELAADIMPWARALSAIGALEGAVKADDLIVAAGGAR